MYNLKESINDLNDLVLQGRTMEAFEKYYHDEVVMQENENVPTIGKEENRRREEQFLSSLIDFRSAKVMEVASGPDVTMVVWQYDYTHKEWGIRNFTQVSIQKWKDGKIIKEQFIYGN